MIDWTRVTELREEIGEEDFSEVVSLFLEEAESAISRIVASGLSASADDYHSLKGSALNLGFRALAAACAEAERRAAAGDHPDPAGIVSGFDAARTGLLRGLSDAAAGGAPGGA